MTVDMPKINEVSSNRQADINSNSKPKKLDQIPNRANSNLFLKLSTPSKPCEKIKSKEIEVPLRVRKIKKAMNNDLVDLLSLNKNKLAFA